ncbi:MAG: indolepyruvate oxidoreductase subunit beta [Elusimicrobia bacterium]|nr:indolepyruvate oxidoreductase subunit beta [Elusimicrobiota bacterium]
MKKDIMLAGVGGQGTLTVSVLLVSAALKEGLNFRQSEVHGMSQRGGAVECHVRLSDGEIFSNIIGRGRADLILALEPLEALRQINYLSPSGIIISNTEPVKNIADYPPQEHIAELLQKSGRKIYFINAGEIAKQAGNVRAQNVALVGAAANFLGLKQESLKQAVKEMFERKGQAIIDVNLKAFELGVSSLTEKMI